MEEIKMHDGCIGYLCNKPFTKEELIKMMEDNFPDDNTYESIANITTIKSNGNENTFQSLMFGKIVKF